MYSKFLRLRLASYALIVAVQLAVITAQDDALAKFGDTIQVLGKMARTDQDFVDGLALDLFSPTNRTLVVTTNMSPLPGIFVAGSSGEGFINLSNYSWVIKLNETANDLIAKIELPYDPSSLKELGIDMANTYVGTLAMDKKSWVVSEYRETTENKTRIIKMTSLDGEYMLLGRKSEDIANIFVQYGQGATRTVNITGGNATQEAEFIDGLRLSIRSAQAFTLNMDIPFGVNEVDMPNDTIALINRDILATKIPGKSYEHLLLARRGLKVGQNETFEVMKNQKFLKSESQIKVAGLSSIDGQYIILAMGENCCGRGGVDQVSGSALQDSITTQHTRGQVQATVASANVTPAVTSAGNQSTETVKSSVGKSAVPTVKVVGFACLVLLAG
ncbi:hypothetical protein BGZ63DRAFT_454703 [Mariannaea sp. PMI_226]|nr:hypothetical protein BGZ63DRAFT_454703 [Mariannaea sp. PMI_226]